ncbi:MAG: HAMP domain-containing protein [Chloroflexi bacterium]|nr:HAMP domain-containing protein [Chloroflexota bacterium]
MSVRLRLTTWYAAVMALTLIGGSVALYLALAFNVLRPAQDQLLADKANGVAGVLARNSQPSPTRQPRPDLFARVLNNTAEGELTLTIRTADGTLAERSANLGAQDLPLSAAAMAAMANGSALYEDISLQGGSFRLLSTPVMVNGELIQIVQASNSMRQVDATLAGLRDALLVGNTILVLLGAVIGWFLAGRWLEPVRRITRTAEAIDSSGQLDRRVAYDGPRDDIGELATAFNNMLERLETSFNSQRRFVSDASHELRTPLTTIRVNMELLRKDRHLAPAGWGDVLDDVTQELERMSRLVQGLLELARVDAGQHLERAPLDLDPLLERLERQTVQLTRDVAVKLKGRPVGRVVANGDALTQLFIILLDNAVKYSPRGSEVSLERGRLDGFVRVRVADCGPGITPEDLPRVFDRFYRAPSVRGRPGTGLGLPIARWIAEEHHGRLTVESAVGKGSVFTVWLPVASS